MATPTVERSVSVVAATIALIVPAGVFTAGLISDFVAVIQGQPLDSDGAVDFLVRAGLLTAGFAFMAFLREWRAFAAREDPTDLGRALETGSIPAGIDTSGWRRQLRRDESRPTWWILIGIAAFTVPLGAAAGLRVPVVIPYAVLTAVAAGILLALVLPGLAERRRRTADLRALLSERAAEHIA